MRRALVIAALACAGGAASAQETIIIGNPRPLPSIEVNLDAIGLASGHGSRAPYPATTLQNSRTPRLDTRPDLLPRNLANMPQARAATSQQLPPPIAATGTPVAVQRDAFLPMSPQQPTSQPRALEAMAPPPPITSVRPPPGAKRPEILSGAPPPVSIITATPPEAPPAPPQRVAAMPSSPVAAAGKFLLFEPGSADLTAEAAGQLSALVASLREGRARVQLKSHASGSDDGAQARRISLKRALAARAVLMEQGIDSTRIDVRALGPAEDGGPPDRIEVILLSQ